MPLKTAPARVVHGKTVIVRVDFNVPLQKKGGATDPRYLVADAQRIRSALETILFLQEEKAKIILISHLGRPEGKVNPAESLKPVANYLRKDLELPCRFIAESIGENVKEAVKELQPGEILLLENLRFHPEEEANDPQFAKKLASLADIYINEAFSASHRAHASIVGITKELTSYLGFSFAFELENLENLLNNPKHPFIVLMGGAKIDDKVKTLESLSEKADLVLVGGGLANAVLKAGGIETHKSIIGVDPQATLLLAKKILKKNKGKRYLLAVKGVKGDQEQQLPLPKIILPLDVLAAKNLDDSSKIEIIDLVEHAQDTKNDRDLQYFDLGPKTIQLYQFLLSQAKTIFWNGPLGVFENPRFAQASKKIAKTLASFDKKKVKSVCGGGETAELVNKLGLQDRFSFVSTAGGATLEFLSGKELPGIKALKASQFPKS